MLEGKIVRVRFRKDNEEQPIWVFVGRVVKFTPEWVGIKGKGILANKRGTISEERKVWKGKSMVVEGPRASTISPIVVDEEQRSLVFPRESIFNIRILPDDYDLDNIRVTINNRRLDLVVDGGPDSSIDEFLED